MVTPDERTNQIRLRRDRLAQLDAILAAQSRYREVSDAIAAAEGKDDAVRAISRLLGVDERYATAVSDLPWRRLAADSRDQAQQDRDHAAALLQELGG